MKAKIALRLWLLIATLVSASLLFVGFSLNSLLENLYYNLQAQSMIKQAEKLDKLIQQDISPQELSHQLDIISDFIEGHIMVLDRQGIVGACNPGMPMHPGMHLPGEEVQELLNGKIVITKEQEFGLESSMLTVAVPIKRNNEVVGSIIVLKPVDPITAAVNDFQQLIFLTAVVTLVLASLLGFFMSRNITRPLLNINKVAQRVAGGDFRERAEVLTQDEVGNLAETFNFMLDELELNLSALSNEKDRLTNILRSMNDGIITFSGSGEVILMNPQAQKILGVSLVKKSLEEISFGKVIKGIIDKAAEANAFIEEEIELGNKVLSLRAAPLKAQEEGPGGTVIAVQDVTLKKKAEELRRDFLSDVSHELRTPLSLLQGYVEALADGMAANEEERKEYLDIILEETSRLNRIVDDLADLNAMEAGQLGLNMHQFSLQEVVNSVLRVFKPASEGQDISLEYKGADELPLLYGDQGRIEQVLINLIGNAIQHTPSGGKVSVSVQHEDHRFVIQVHDTGEGIPAEELTYIWERFYRVDKARTRKKGGSGLGLAIVRSLVEAHQGSVAVKSAPGKGSIFTVMLPDRQETGKG